MKPYSKDITSLRTVIDIDLGMLVQRLMKLQNNFLSDYKIIYTN